MAYSRQELIEQELEWRRCSTDRVHFVNSHCYMWAKEGGAPVDWTLWDFQEEALRAFADNRLNIVLKARQMGLSWCVCAEALYSVMFTENFKVYFQSLGKDEVGEQFDRIRFMYDNLPAWMKDRVGIGGITRKSTLKNNTSRIEFSNGSAILAKATTRNAGQGSAPGLYILDEFALNEKAQDTWRAVSPAAAGVGRVIVISTARGVGNKFFDLWRDASSGANSFVPFFIAASRHPEYTQTFLEERRMDFAGDAVGYLQAYPEKPSDAFQTSASCPFDRNRLKALQDRLACEKLEPEVGTLSGDDNIVFTAGRSGLFQIWKHPSDKGHYVIGADVAMGMSKESGDFSVAIVLDVDSCEVVAMFRARIEQEYYAGFLDLLGRYYNKAWIAVERNAVAGVVIENLKVTYPWLYRQRVTGETFFDRTRVEIGFWTSAQSKPRLIANLRRAISDPQHPMAIPSKTILDELANYEQDSRGRLRASGNHHDDCVMSLALAVEAMNNTHFVDEDETSSQTLSPYSY